MSYVGVDLQKIDRSKPIYNLKAIARCLFSQCERERLERSVDYFQSFYGLFCAKEAVFKAMHPLSSGGAVEVKTLRQLSLRFAKGRPTFQGDAAIRQQLAAAGYAVDVSISHSDQYAVGFAIIHHIPVREAK